MRGPLGTWPGMKQRCAKNLLHTNTAFVAAPSTSRCNASHSGTGTTRWAVTTTAAASR